MTRTTGGSVRHHATRDLWEARYIGADGRRHSVYARTREAAQEQLRAALGNRDHGIRPVSQQLTVSAWLEEWLTTSVAARCRPSTARSYRETVDRYIRPAIGRLPLAKLEPEEVHGMLARLSDRGDLSPTTVRYAYAVLRIALGRALKSGRVVRNACTLIDPPAKMHRELEPLSAAQARILLAGVRGDRLEALYVAAFGTGLRQGELLGLSWQDLDLEHGTLAVRHTLQRGTRTLAEPKTERARRLLRLPQPVVAALIEHRSRQTIVPLSGLVFTTDKGTALDTRNVTRYLQRHLARLNLPHQRFHDLRHAFATLMIEGGEDLGVVSRILGHADFATTADVYAHLTPAMLDRAAERMSGILGG
ncbi:MAG: site-specific integrase [Chloroflexota bacterium]|nr:site-specific integrase [Chloroflexota bacterium]